MGFIVQNPISSLMPFVNEDLKDLDIDPSGKIIKKSDPNTIISNPDKQEKIKSQFLKCVQLSQTVPTQPSPSLDISGIKNDIQSLEMTHERILFLKKLSGSPLAKILFPDTASLESFSKQNVNLQQSFEQTIQTALQRFKEVTEKAQISQYDELNTLRNKIYQLDDRNPAHESLKNKVESAITALFDRKTMNFLTEAVEHQLPDLHIQLSRLSDLDRQLLFKSLVNSLDLGYVDTKFPLSVKELKVLSNYYSIFSATYRALDQLQDPTIRDEAKKCIFSLNRFYSGRLDKIVEGCNQDQLKEMVGLIGKLKSNNESFEYILETLLSEFLLVETKEKPAKILQILRDLQELNEKHGEILNFNSIESSFTTQISLMKTDYEICKRLSKYSWILMYVSDSRDRAIVFDRLMDKVPKETFNEFGYAFSSLSYNEKQHLYPCLEDLASASSDITQKGLQLFAKLMENLSVQNTNEIIRLFQRRPLETMLNDVEQLTKAFESCSWKENKFEAYFDSHPSQRYNEVFKCTENPASWKQCRQTLQKYPDLLPIFDKWANQVILTQSSSSEAWTNDILQTGSEFKKLLFRLFEIEKYNPPLFVKIIQTLQYDQTSNSLSALVKCYFLGAPAPISALLSQLKAEPSLIAHINEALIDDRIFARNIHRIDPKTLSFMIKESRNPNRLKAMVMTYLNDPDKMRLICDIESSSPTPLIWKEASPENYQHSDIKKLELIKKFPQIRQAVEKKGFVYIPWNQLPTDFMNLKPELPELALKLLELHEQLKTTETSPIPNKVPFSIQMLLENALSYETSLAEDLIKLKPGDQINYAGFLALIQIARSQGDAFGRVCCSLLVPDSKGWPEVFNFLNSASWSPAFTNMLDRLEMIYGLQKEDTIEQRVRQLPVRWKWALLGLWVLGMRMPHLAQPLSEFITKHPNIALVEKLFNVLNGALWGEELETIRNFDRFTSGISAVIAPRMLNLNRFIRDFEKRFPLEDFAYLFTTESMLNTAYDIFIKSPALIPKMIEWDKRLAPPAGKVFSNLFNENIQAKLETNPAFAETVQQVGLNNIDLSLYTKLGGSYLYMIRALKGRSQGWSKDKIIYDTSGIYNIVNHPACSKAIIELDWSKLKDPVRFADHILSVASWGQMEPLSMLLEWIIKSDYKNAENLLDMAKAGYVPEAAAIIERNLKDPNNADNILLLEQAGSVNALPIQRRLQGLPDEAPISLTPAPGKNPMLALNAIKARIEPLQKHTLENEEQRKRALETEFSVAIAEQLLTPSGHLDHPMIEVVRQYLKSQDIFPTGSDFWHYLQSALNILEHDPEFSQILAGIEISRESASPAAQLVRRQLGLSASASTAHWHAKVAALSAILSRPRQSANVNSCFGTSWAIISQSDKNRLKQSLKDYGDLLRDNRLVRMAPGKIEGTYSYPLGLLPKRMKEPVLFENLLLKARENVLANMGGNAQDAGLVQKNLSLFFDEKGFYSEKIDKLHSGKPPVSTEAIINELRNAFNKKVKAVVQYEDPHPVSNNFGWWLLERRDKKETVPNLESYRRLHVDIIEAAQKKLKDDFPYEEAYIQKVFRSLKMDVNSPYFEEEIIPGVKKGEIIEKMVSTPWMGEKGGHPEAAIAADLQFETNKMPYVAYKSQNPEEMFSLLCSFYNNLPQAEKIAFLKEPERLHPLTIPGHALGLKPSFLLSMSVDKIKKELDTHSSILLKDIPKMDIQKWVDKWVSLMPKSMKKPFKELFSSNKLDQMTVEDSGKALMDSFISVSGTQPDFKTFNIIEDEFFKDLPPEVQKKMPFQIIGDLNWDAGSYNNSYLACARSPLTGNLSWYICCRHGDGRRLYPWDDINSGWWYIMEPLSRKVNGCVSFK